jgi:hypothetical protein
MDSRKIRKPEAKQSENQGVWSNVLPGLGRLWKSAISVIISPEKIGGLGALLAVARVFRCFPDLI